MNYTCTINRFIILNMFMQSSLFSIENIRSLKLHIKCPQSNYPKKTRGSLIKIVHKKIITIKKIKNEIKIKLYNIIMKLIIKL